MEGLELEEFPGYVVYPDGRLYSNRKKDYIIPQKNGKYYRTSIMDKNAKRRFVGIHQLVARAFIPNPDNLPISNHKDGDGYNNNAENLEWMSVKENNIHARDNGLVKYYTRPVIQYDLKWNELNRYDSAKKAADAVGCSPSSIYNVCNERKKTCKGFRWKYEKELDVKHNIGEELRVIPSHPKFRATPTGRIYSTKTKRYMKQGTRRGEKGDYLRVNINKKMVSVHKLVAETFIGLPPEGMDRPVVNHKDGNKQNNHINNLEWIEHRDNVQHAHDTGLNSTCIPVVQYSLDGKELNRYKSSASAAKIVGCSHTAIADACKKKKHVHSIKGFVWRYEDDPLTQKEIDSLHTAKSRVVQYSLTCERIREFDSMNEAEKFTGANHAAISQCCRFEIESAGGYQWRYSNDDSPTKAVKGGCQVKVAQYERDMVTFIRIWDSIAEAARALGMKSTSHITSVCKGRRNTTGGYNWKTMENHLKMAEETPQ